VNARGNPRFFFDANLSSHLAAGMRSFGESVEHISETFVAGAEDAGWLPYVGSNGLVLATRDLRIWQSPAEIALVRHHKIGGFILAGHELDRCGLIQQLIRHWPLMKRTASKEPRPYLYRLRKTGAKLIPVLR
jgi:hypothetical protein